MIRKLEKEPDGCIQHSKLLQRMHVKTKELGEIVSTMEQSGLIKIIVTPRNGTSKKQSINCYETVVSHLDHP